MDTATPPGPLMSVTVPPTGQCYHLARGIIGKLSRPSRGDLFPPHLTLQAIFSRVPDQRVVRAVRAVAEQTDAFEIQVDGLGILPAPRNPSVKYVYLSVVKDAPLVNLYVALKERLEAIGVETYPYSADEWIPHLTVASGRWSWRKVERVIEEIAQTPLDCCFLARAVQVNRAQPDGTWATVARISLRRPGQMDFPIERVAI